MVVVLGEVLEASLLGREVDVVELDVCVDDVELDVVNCVFVLSSGRSFPYMTTPTKMIAATTAAAIPAVSARCVFTYSTNRSINKTLAPRMRSCHCEFLVAVSFGKCFGQYDCQIFHLRVSSIGVKGCNAVSQHYRAEGTFGNNG